MSRLFEFFIEAIFWLLLFLSPALFFSAISLLIYINTDNSTLAGIILVTGIISGISFAEYIRRKHGCSDYLSRIFSTPDIDKKNNSPES